MGLLCVFVGQYRLHIEGNLMEVEVPQNCLIISMIISLHELEIFRMRLYRILYNCIGYASVS